ncbi:unnamed protein product [Jaminaea pallidilutea]
MPAPKKGSGKSSASSATRKKQAAKAAKKAGQDPTTAADATPTVQPGQAQRGQKKDKKSKKEPKKKVFIPPPKPPQAAPDPLDTLGLASLLPAGLVVLLRKAAKKDVVTRSRALEGLLAWIDGTDEDGEAASLEHDGRDSALVLMLPSWVHLFPRLVASPTRRLRALTAQLHARLLSSSFSTRDELTQSPQYIEPTLGPWATLAWDTDRSASASARQCWEGAVSWSSLEEGRIDLNEHLPQLANYLSLLLVQGSSSATPGPSTPAGPGSLSRNGSAFGDAARDAKNRDEANVEEDPKAIDARLAAGALGSLTWALKTHSAAAECEEVVNLLHSSALWTALYAQDHGEDSQPSFGTDYPVVRSRAWDLVELLSSKHTALVGQILESLAPNALTAAWEERDVTVQRHMLDALLPLLTQHKDAWNHVEVDDDSEDGASNEGEDADEDEGDSESKTGSESSSHLSSKLSGFQRWVQLGCGGHPGQGLPALLVLLTTIPDGLFATSGSAWKTFLNNFWSTLDSGVYDGADRTLRPLFFATFAETTAYVVGRISKADKDDAATLAAELLGRLWSEGILKDEVSESSDGRRMNALASKRIASLHSATDERFASTLGSLAALGVAAPLVEVVFGSLNEVAAGDRACSGASGQRAAAILERISQTKADSTLQEVITSQVDKLASSVATEGNVQHLSSRVSLLSALLSHFAAQTGGAARTFAQQMLPKYVSEGSLSPSVLHQFVAAFTSALPAEQTQPIIVDLVDRAASADDPNTKLSNLESILDGLPAGVTLQSAEGTKLDDVVLDVASQLTAGSASAEGGKLLSRLLTSPGSLLDGETVKQVLGLLVSYIDGVSRADLIGHGSVEGRESVDRVVGIVAAWLSGDSNRFALLDQSGLRDAATAAAFRLRFFPSRPSSASVHLWQTVCSQPNAAALALGVLRDSVLDTQIEIVIVLEAALRASESKEGLDLSVIDVLPSQQDSEKVMLSALNSSAPSSSLSILDPLVPQGRRPSNTPSTSFDVEGFTPFIRSSIALLLALEDSRATARSHPWALPHLIAMAIACEDRLQAADTSSRFFDANSFSSEHGQRRLRDLLQRSVRVSSGMMAALCGSLPDSWHVSTTEKLQKGTAATDDVVVPVVMSLWQHCIATPDSAYLPRMFSRLLTGLLSFTSAGEQEATRWLRLATSVESKAPSLAEAVLYAAKPLVYDTPFYDRQRNDYVSRLATTPPAKANGEGIRLLRLTLAAAPPLESSMSLVPQQRAVFLLQGLQRWFASDEEFDDELNTRLAELFLHLVLIVQEMPGSHLDFFYDLIESNLEVASWTDEASLPALFHTLRVLELLADLASTNAMLRDVFKEHEKPIVELLEPLFAALPEQGRKLQDSLPKQLCAELTVSAIKRSSTDLHSSPMHQETLCKLLSSPVRGVQAAAFRMLTAAVRKNVQEMIFESATEMEAQQGEETAGEVIEKKAKTPVQLPSALIAAVSTPVDVTAEDIEEDVGEAASLLSYLFAWLALFEHFEESTVQLKSLFSAQVQREGLVERSLLPTIFGLLEPQRTRKGVVGSASMQEHQPFDPERYAIDEIFLDFVDPADSMALRQLAVHVYLRCLLYLPTHVREWWLGIKDRQLSLGVGNFTARHCTPVITTRELAHLREPEALSRLQDEAMSIKVLGSNEVVATYTVDEHPMEIGVRIPPDYPLHGVEVRDIRRVGVSEAQWRAWLLAVQQLIVGPTSGLVVDALMLFKRNAEAKFAGFEGAECAICYSIISPEDRSLPSKPCKTCKNKFHAACLYKWLHSSGSATCPLCRSIL